MSNSYLQYKYKNMSDQTKSDVSIIQEKSYPY